MKSDWEVICDSGDPFETALDLLKNRAPVAHDLDLAEFARELFSQWLGDIEEHSPADALLTALIVHAAESAFASVDMALGVYTPDTVGRSHTAMAVAEFYEEADSSPEPIGWDGLREGIENSVEEQRAHRERLAQIDQDRTPGEQKL